MSDKKTVIIEMALQILHEEGYPSLTMRNLAKACDMKLASLQYHFKNWQILMDAIADYLISTYLAVWEEKTAAMKDIDIGDFVQIAFEDLADYESCSQWPQLWAMAQREEAVKQALEKIYARYLEFIEAFLEGKTDSPKEDAIIIMSMMEGLYLFVGEQRTYDKHRAAIQSRLISYLRHAFSA